MVFCLRKIYLFTILIFFISITNLSGSSAKFITFPFSPSVEAEAIDFIYCPFLKNYMLPTANNVDVMISQTRITNFNNTLDTPDAVKAQFWDSVDPLLIR